MYSFEPVWNPDRKEWVFPNAPHLTSIDVGGKPDGSFTTRIVLNNHTDAYPHPKDGIWVPGKKQRIALRIQADSNTHTVYYPNGHKVVSRYHNSHVDRKLITPTETTTFPTIRLELNNLVEVSDQHFSLYLTPAAYKNSNGQWQWWDTATQQQCITRLAEASSFTLPR